MKSHELRASIDDRRDCERAAGWPCVEFEHVFRVISLQGLKIPENEYLESGPLPVIDQGAQLVSGYTNDFSKVIEVKNPVIVFGDHTRCFKFVDFAFAPGADGIKVLCPKESIDPRFAYFACLAAELPNRGYSRHYSFLKQLQFPMPEIAQQRRIVALVDEVLSTLNEGNASLNIAQERLRLYYGLLLNQLVTGKLLVSLGLMSRPFSSSDRTPLGKLVAKIDQGWSPKCLNQPVSEDEAWGVIKTTAVQAGRFDDFENKQLPSHLEPRINLAIVPGDLLITRAGPRSRVGVACLVRHCRPRVMICDKVYRLRVDCAKIRPAYLELLLNSPKITNEIETRKTGINDSGVNLTQMRFLSLELCVPSLEVQDSALLAMDAVLSGCQNLGSQITAAHAEAETLRLGFLRKAFSGRLGHPRSFSKQEN